MPLPGARSVENERSFDLYNGNARLCAQAGAPALAHPREKSKYAVRMAQPSPPHAQHLASLLNSLNEQLVARQLEDEVRGGAVG